MYCMQYYICIIAMQMWTFARVLPMVIGYLVPENDEHWQNFIRLLEIMDYLFAHTVLIEDCGYLETLINDHHMCFKMLYPHTSISMKMHSMIHMPGLMLE